MKDILKNALASGRRSLLLHEALKLCETYSIPVAKYGVANTLEQAVELGRRIGYPVVLKVISPDIAHKSDVGGVMVSIMNDDELQESYTRIHESVKKYLPNAMVIGVLVQEMVPTPIEVIVGLKRDRQFGPVIMFGLGGVFVEILKDVSFRICPIDKQDAMDMITEIKGYPILKGYRNIPSVDIQALADILLLVSRMALEEPVISEMDLNPIAVDGRCAKVLDARVLLKVDFTTCVDENPSIM